MLASKYLIKIENVLKEYGDIHIAIMEDDEIYYDFDTSVVEVAGEQVLLVSPEGFVGTADGVNLRLIQGGRG